MRKILLAVAALTLAPGAPALAASPTVVELYQSQGCSSCPPAIANVNALAGQSNVLALTFAVTYWDRLGWKDTFAKPAFTSRQYDYAHGLQHASVYTPQVVINGRSDLTGIERRELAGAISHAAPLSGPDIAVDGSTVSISAGSSHTATDVWLVRYDPHTLSVKIGAGENGGVTIAHRNVVRDLLRLGAWHGAAQNYRLPQPDGHAWRSAILVQQADGGPILSAKSF